VYGARLVMLYVVIVCNTPQWRICNVTHQREARDGGPVELHPVRATPCFIWFVPAAAVGETYAVCLNL